jgi:Leucine-rich repeat (LRR) protein
MLRPATGLVLFGLLAACDDTGSPPAPSWRQPATTAKAEAGAALAASGDAAPLPLAPKRKTAADCKLSDPIEFTDKVMEQAVKFALQVDGGFPDKVKRADLLNVKTLNLKRYGKSSELDICLIPLMTNLKEIHFNGDVDDLTPIGGLSTLELVTASFTRVSDITTLGSLGKLKSVDISHTQVANIQPLERLTNLQTLALDGDTGVEDLAPLTASLKLESLSIAKTGVTNLGPLSQLRQLKKITITDSPVSDLSPLSGQMARGLKVVK